MEMGNYILFESENEFSLELWSGANIEYSTDASTWRKYNAGSLSSAYPPSVISSSGGKLYLRGNGNRSISGVGNYCVVIESGSNISCKGNIENLLDYATVASGGHPAMAAHCFDSLFAGCSKLISAPELPATTLAESCYMDMFRDCIGLTEVPDLPATTLGERCYCGMFSGCTGLTKAPELPATTLAKMCYYEMFYGCTSLTEVPNLPAENLADDCYRMMFEGCKNLGIAPSISATVLAKNCYDRMFAYCTNLFIAPELPVTTLAEGCYRLMFFQCLSLYEMPELPATTLATSCYNAMFYGCWNLQSALTLPATTLAASCYEGMFNGCISMTEVRGLPATTLATNCYSGMFSGCTGLTKAPELPATTLATKCYYEMFKGCTSLTEVPDLPATVLAEKCYARMFYGCNTLSATPKLPATTLAPSCYNEMFYGCVKFTEAPKLPAKTLAERCYDRMFTYCNGITEAPEFPATTLAEGCYKGMFQNSKGLVTASALPATTLAADCYNSMFAGCAALTSIPALPAAELPSGCYYEMFRGCTALIIDTVMSESVAREYRIPWDNDGVAEEDSLTDMFAGTGGTFTGTPEINRTYYTSGEAALPKHTATVSHNGKVIAEADAGQTVTLKCAGMKMAGDVVVELADASDPFVPTGTKHITENGTYDVTDYANAEVNVPSSIPDGYLKPAGTKAITENGTHDVTEYASVSVAVPDRELVLQEKVAEANGVVTADDGYDGLSKVTVNVEKSADGYTAYDLSTDQMHYPRLKFKIPRPTETQQSLFVDAQIALIPQDVEHLYEIVRLDYAAIPIAEGISITPLYFRYGDVHLYYVWENDVEITKAAFAAMGTDTSGITGEGWIGMTDVARSLTEEEVASLNPFWLYEYVAPYGDYFDSLFNFRVRSDDEFADVIDITNNRNSSRVLCTERTVMDKDIYVRDRGQVYVSVMDEDGNSVDGVDDSNYYEYDSVGYLNVEVIGELDSDITVNCYALNGRGTFKEFTAFYFNGDKTSDSYTFSRCYTYGIKLSSPSPISRIITNAVVVSNDGSEAYISGLRHDTFIVVVMA